MSLIKELSELGVNIEEALERFMNNQQLYERMLGKFPAAARDAQLTVYFESGDYEAAERNAHNLKGVTGNLSITPLFNAYTEIVALLRTGEYAKAKEVLEETLPCEEKIIKCIEDNF